MSLSNYLDKYLVRVEYWDSTGKGVLEIETFSSSIPEVNFDNGDLCIDDKYIACIPMHFSLYISKVV